MAKQDRGGMAEQVAFRIPRELRDYYERKAETAGRLLSAELRQALERDRQVQEVRR